MFKIDFSKLGDTTIKAITKHSPEILAGMGIVGFIGTVVLAVKATPKALQEIDDAKVAKAIELGKVRDNKEFPELKIAETEKVELTKKEIVKATWKCYIPAAAMGAASTGCIIASTVINNKQKIAAATAFEVTRAAFADYKSKVVDTIGEKKEQKIRDEISKDTVTKNPPSQQTIIAGTGTVRCYDEWTGAYFDSDIESIRKAINTLNYRMMSEMYISLSEFYDELNIPKSKVGKLGDELGWNLNDGQIEVSFSSVLPEDGRPVLAINYSVAPRYNFSKLQ